MALQGKIIELAKDRYGFESISANYNQPTVIRHVWEIATIRTRGMSYCRIEESIGRDASITDGRVSCYLGNGNYVYGELAEFGSTRAILVEETPVPKPRVRKDTETRWYAGQWQKLTRKGWQAA